MDDWEFELYRTSLGLITDWIKDRWRSRRGSRGAELEVPAESQEITEAADIEAELDVIAFRQRSAMIAASVERLRIRQGNLDSLRIQAAKWGDALVPPILVNGIRDEEQAIDAEVSELRGLLKGVSRRDLS